MTWVRQAQKGLVQDSRAVGRLLLVAVCQTALTCCRMQERSYIPVRSAGKAVP